MEYSNYHQVAKSYIVGDKVLKEPSAFKKKNLVILFVCCGGIQILRFMPDQTLLPS